MKHLILISLIVVARFSYAQEIFATTSAGKKVILNINNYTWRYANSEDSQDPCKTTRTASVLIQNNTSQDIYFYCFGDYTGGTLTHTKIKAHTPKQIDRLYTVWGQRYDLMNCQYKWKASYELYDDTKFNEYPQSSFDGLTGFESGNFILNDCETKTITIEQ
ncbi:MAG: hypothetical protein JWN78_771 [Bacteroidota bacterium]|nr:hypothetical protein [Bacteroidota bacterium]